MRVLCFCIIMMSSLVWWSQILLIAGTGLFSIIFVFATAGQTEFRLSLVVVARVIGGGRDVSRVAAYSVG